MMQALRTAVLIGIVSVVTLPEDSCGKKQIVIDSDVVTTIGAIGILGTLAFAKGYYLGRSRKQRAEYPGYGSYQGYSKYPGYTAHPGYPVYPYHPHYYGYGRRHLRKAKYSKRYFAIQEDQVY